VEAAASVADATGDFFAELGRRGHEPLLQKLTGTFRFDVTGERDEHWFVGVSKGDITVSRRNDKADCSVRSDRDVFDAVVSGEANALAATLRGAVVIEGDIGLLAGFQRLFPGPPAVKPKAKAEARTKTKTKTKTSSPAGRPKKTKRS
jgi:putative sterol carrier protein